MTIIPREARHRLATMAGARTRSLTDAARATCSPRMLRDLVVGNAGLIVLGVLTAAFGALLVALVIFPRYRDPSARLFTSKLGYAGIARKLEKPFSVSAATVRHRELTAVYQGDGLVRSEPVQVPVIPMGTILRVNADVGDRVAKGQVLVEIDPRRA